MFILRGQWPLDYQGLPRIEYGWSLWYLSEVSLVVTWSLMWDIFLRFSWTFQKIIKNLNFMLNTNFLYQQNAHFIDKISISHFIRILLDHKGKCNFEFQKFIIKNRIIKKKCLVIWKICDRIWQKGPYRAFWKNRVIATIGKSRLWATKCATYLVMKAKCSGVIAVSVHSFLSTAIG